MCVYLSIASSPGFNSLFKNKRPFRAWQPRPLDVTAATLHIQPRGHPDDGVPLTTNQHRLISGLTLWRHRRQHGEEDPPFCLRAALLQLLNGRPQSIDDVRVGICMLNLLLRKLQIEEYSNLCGSDGQGVVRR